ncbi:YlbL family protein [Bifidobacterium sp.]|jgi:PDZ domain-containing protein|uniref:YlbL family protein n=1 Tax=Bifidobacterium sp. TaxID=41200 RepID=UPI0025B7FFE5|nr:S16 family serine protease [Bifidobacterium sp.]MCI1225194.1 Lon protease [Bifidobacterium sp.]
MHAHEHQPMSGEPLGGETQDEGRSEATAVRRHHGFPARTFAIVRDYFASRPLRYQAGLICLALCVIVLVMPSPYVVESPGPTRDVLHPGEGGSAVIAISGFAGGVHNDPGQLRLVTVNASGVPGYPAGTAQAMWGWLNTKQAVTPSEAVFPVGQDADSYRKESQGEMTGSQDAASTAALNYAQRLGVDVSGVKVSMHVDDIGGPSAGMMYSLGVIDKLTPQEETGGASIAGTGTIDKKGKVGAIGGIRLKMIGARRDGATWFLAPASNCDEVVGHVPKGLRDVRVSTLDEAYRALVAIGQGNGEALPHCSVGSAK